MGKYFLRRWCRYGPDQRQLDTVYRNRTDVPLEVYVQTSVEVGHPCALAVWVDQNILTSGYGADIPMCGTGAYVPNGSQYRVAHIDATAGPVALLAWYELRPSCLRMCAAADAPSV